MKLPSFALSPPWLRFFAAAAIFLAWFIVLLFQHAPAPGSKPLLDPAQFVSIDKYVLIGLVGYHAGDKTPAGDGLLMRLLAGIGLLGMWVWLVVATVVQPGDLVDAMAVGLFMLGVLPSTNPADLPLAAAPPQAGFARWRMLAFLSALGLGGMSLLGGCASTPQAAQAQYVQECAAYGTALTLGAQMKAAGKLNAAQVQQLLLIDSQITPICSGQLPADPTSATQKVTAALTTLAILEGTKK
jgi:hypothetical protein